MLRKTKKGIRIKIFVGKSGSIFWLDCVYMLKNVNRKSHPSENDKNALSHWALELIAFYLCRGRRAPEKDKREGIKNNCSQTRMLHVIELHTKEHRVHTGIQLFLILLLKFPRFFVVVLSPPPPDNLALWLPPWCCTPLFVCLPSSPQPPQHFFFF